MSVADPARPSDVLAQLAASAVLGTDRLGGAPPLAVPVRVEAIAGDLVGPERVLALAAGLGQYAAAGLIPGEVRAEGDAVADDEADRPAPPALVRLIDEVLEHEARVLPECLELLAVQGFTAPRESLPALLDHAATKAGARDAVCAVIGGRGRWLASQNPDWEFAAGNADSPQTPAAAEDLEQGWQTSGVDHRVALLRGVRVTDPARAIELIRSTWDEDDAKDRAKFLEQLEVGLSSNDEVFLEWVFDSGKVAERSRAASLLAGIPGSALGERMSERLSSIIAVEAKSAGVLRKKTKVALDAAPPEAPDEAMKRDGIRGGTLRGMGKKGTLLARLISLAPPGFLIDRHDLEAGTVIDAAKASDWWAAFRHGWAESIIRCADQRVSAAWSRELVLRLDEADITELSDVGLLDGVLAKLEPGDEAPVSALLKLNSAASSVLVRAGSGVWDLTLSKILVDLPNQQFELNSEYLALRCHPQHLTRVRGRMGDSAPQRTYAGYWERWKATVDLRIRLHQEMNRV